LERKCCNCVKALKNAPGGVTCRALREPIGENADC